MSGKQTIEDFVYENLRKVSPSGDGFLLACCPKHKNGQERNPSFTVNKYTGRYQCFSCHIKGDFDELKRMLNLAHVAVDTEAAAHEKPQKDVQENDNLNEAILTLFHQCPIDLLEAGFSEELLQSMEIGFDDLYRRTTFPIRSATGKLVAISGRGPKGCEPRYKVYTHWMLRGAADEHYAPKNKDHLYGLHTIPVGTTPVILVEGYKGCLWVRQAGFPHTVATMGTKVTEAQIDLLRKFTNRVIILFDMDQSGREAAISVQLLLAKKGVPAAILKYSTDRMEEPSPDDLTTNELQVLLSPYFQNTNVPSTNYGVTYA